MIFSPVALFVYNRPWHTQKTIEALQSNEGASETILYIFSDAAKNSEALKEVEKVREYIGEITGFKAIHIIEREKNLGLARSIIDGVSRVCAEHGQVIVMEDDLVTSPYFLQFMNDGLEKYRDDVKVVSISGYSYPIEGLPETYFLRGADCWGWATWARAWNLFEVNGESLLFEMKAKNLTWAFDSNGTYPFTKMLSNQVAGRVDSWAIRWHATAFLRELYTLYPGRSLVENIGLDNSGVHCGVSSELMVNVSTDPVVVRSVLAQEEAAVREKIMAFHRRMRPPFLHRVLRRVGGLLGKNG